MLRAGSPETVPESNFMVDDGGVCARRNGANKVNTNNENSNVRFTLNTCLFSSIRKLIAYSFGFSASAAGVVTLALGASGILNSEFGISTLASIWVKVIFATLPGLRGDPLSMENGK